MEMLPNGLPKDPLAVLLPVAGPCTGCRCCIRVPEPPPLNLKPQRSTVLATIAIGPSGQALFDHTGPFMADYAAHVGADFVVLDDYAGHPEWPMGSKFGIHRLLDFYDRVAYVDADVLLRPGCVNLFDSCHPDEFGATDEFPFLWARGFWLGWQETVYKFRLKMRLQARRNLPWYMNTGVMVFSQRHRKYLTAPDMDIPKDHCSEQHWINSTLLDAGEKIRFLDWRCNCQKWWKLDFNTAPEEAILHWSGDEPHRSRRIHEIRMWAEKYRVTNRS